MDAFFKRADQADDILKALTQRVALLEKKKSAAPAGGPQVVGMHKDVAAYVKKQVQSMKKEVLAYEKKLGEKDKLIASLQKQLAAAKKAGGKKAAPAAPATGSKEQFKQLRARVAALRPKIVELEQENASLKEQLAARAAAPSGIPTELTSNEVEYIRNKVLEIRAKVERELAGKSGAPAAAPAVAAVVSTGLEKQTMDTIQERKMYKVTTDLAELKKEWYEAELGELDDEDFQTYLGREVKSLDVEEDDDTVNVRFDNHDTQWFPVGCLYKVVEVAAAPAPVAKKAAPAGPTLVKQTMDSIQERKMYKVTTDLAELKREWYEAELGELDDEDFQVYLGREVKSLDVEEDDDTVNVRFDNHDTQWFPVGCLYKEEAAAAVAAPVVPAGPTLEKQTMDSIKERKMYKVTTDLAELKREWYEAELGELDDEDFQVYLGREVKSLDVEEDDDTVNVRFDNHDTQWFPVGCLYKVVEGGSAAPAPAKPVDVNNGKTKQTMDSIKERKMYFVTMNLQELKKEWYEAELGELDDEDFQVYLGREVKSLDVEEDDDTVNVRFDNHDTQWFPVGCLYQA